MSFVFCMLNSQRKTSGAEMKGTVLLATLWIQSVILPVYTVTIIATILVHRLLKANLKMSETSKKMHKEIMKVNFVYFLFLYFVLFH